ncbi:hypothetical protein [Pseudoalteromonas marina]|uniref:hypothetical protein n=1 Tax=Pseudoalteromonas marina TaxID=267375 RepID=UPI003C6A8DEB
MIVVGCDPDSKKHGIATYVDGELSDLAMCNNQQIIDWSLGMKNFNNLLFSIEDVCANNFVYTRNNKGNKSVTSKIAMSIGRCQQAQKELMMWLDHYNIKYVLHKPQKGNWAKNKKEFEKITGWKKRSNEDTRSAAYMGYLALK